MTDEVIGTCSCCGGAVVVPRVWSGVGSPRPTCVKCGAVRALPVIEMVPPAPQAPKWRPDGILRQLGKPKPKSKAGEP